MATLDDDMCPYLSDEDLTEEEEEEEVEEEEAEADLDEELEYREDSDNDSGDDDDAELTTMDSQRRNDGHEAQVLSSDDVLMRQQEAVDEVVGILNLSREHASILLRAYKWNVSHTTDEWFANEAAVRERLGLLESVAEEEGTSRAADAKGKGEAVTCGICFEHFARSETSAAACGHRYCNVCWGSLVNVAIEGGPGCLSLRCPSPGCSAAVGDDMVLRHAGPTHTTQFRRFLLHSYVDSSTNVKWCPAPGCGFAVALDSWRAGPSSAGPSSSQGMGGTGGCMSANVECRCNHWFCWNCLEEPHKPVECDVVKKWLVKNSAESENMNWILAHSKACPKCKRPIEKDHGCMHMTCSAPCKYEFCWLCLGDWKAHSDSTGGFYACNRYEDAKKKGELTDDEQRKDRARQSLERYLHFYERWATNETSRKKAVESLHEVKERQADMLREFFGFPAAQLSFLEDAWQQIVECRRVLKWTYAYGYYLGGDGDQGQRRRNLFEYLQGQAEGALGGLHKCAEKDVEAFLPTKFQGSFDSDMQSMGPPEKGDFMAFKSDLTRLTAVTRNFFDNLVRALENGLAEVTDVLPEPTGPPAKGKGTGTKRRRKTGKKGENDDDDESGMAMIDSGDEDEESGEEGGTNMGAGGSGQAYGSSSAEEPEYWPCTHCTFANPRESGNVCAMCRLPREGAAPFV